MTVSVTAVPDSRLLHLAVSNCLDLSVATELWRAMRGSAALPAGYVVNLSAVESCQDSGLAMLIMLARCAQRSGLGMRVVECSAAVQAHCARLGVQRCPGGSSLACRPLN